MHEIKRGKKSNVNFLVVDDDDDDEMEGKSEYHRLPFSFSMCVTSMANDKKYQYFQN